MCGCIRPFESVARADEQNIGPRTRLGERIRVTEYVNDRLDWDLASMGLAGTAAQAPRLALPFDQPPKSYPCTAEDRAESKEGAHR